MRKRSGAQLTKYAGMVDGVPLVTPRDVPALVWQHLPSLKPAARNKMFNAELIMRKDPGTPQIPSAYPTLSDSARQNFDAIRPLLVAASEKVQLVVPQLQNSNETTFAAYIGEVTSKAAVDAIASLKWTRDDHQKPEIAFLREIEGQITKWVVIAPQVGGTVRDLPGIGSRSIVERKRRQPTREIWGETTDPKHRHAIKRLAGSGLLYADAEIASRIEHFTAGLLIYPMAEEPSKLPATPQSRKWSLRSRGRHRLVSRSHPQGITFRPRNSARAHAVIVDNTGNG